MTPQEAALRGRIGAYVTHATHDPRETTAAARRTFRDSFLEQVDPDRTLPPEERRRRAEALYRAHMARLALKSARTRAQKARRRANGRPKGGSATQSGLGQADGTADVSRHEAAGAS